VSRSISRFSLADPGAGGGSCPAGRGAWCSRVGALERVRYRILGAAKDAGGLAGGEAEDVAQDQHGALARRQPLERGDER